MGKQRILLFCTFPLWIQKNRLSGPVWDHQILQNWPRNASRSAQVAPRWRPNRPLDPPDGRPAEHRALQTAFQTVQESILDVPGPSGPRFWPPGINCSSNLKVPRPILDAQGSIFQPPGIHFPAQTSLFPQSSMPASLQSSKVGEAECVKRLISKKLSKNNLQKKANSF